MHVGWYIALDTFLNYTHGLGIMFLAWDMEM